MNLLSLNNIPFFTPLLMKWHREQNTRMLPWKEEKDPYRIWISEIMLQQTRAEQVLPYYSQFMKTFPTIEMLAKADEAKVFKLWEGLGYYSRCKNILFTAKKIHKDYNNKFPNNYPEILALKGIGTYTAAAIASFAFNLPYPVIDGNVQRVLTRYTAFTDPIDTNDGKKAITNLAHILLPPTHPAEYNQAIMDFGANVCKPITPLCTQCIFKEHCLGYEQKIPGKLPIKSKKTAIKKRNLTYIVLSYKDFFFIRKRTKKDIWENLYEFLLLPENSKITLSDIKKNILEYGEYNPENIHTVLKKYSQKLTHQIVFMQFIIVKMLAEPTLPDTFQSVTKQNLKKYPFPKIINDFLSDTILSDTFKK